MFLGACILDLRSWGWYDSGTKAAFIELNGVRVHDISQNVGGSVPKGLLIGVLNPLSCTLVESHLFDVQAGTYNPKLS